MTESGGSGAHGESAALASRAADEIKTSETQQPEPVSMVGAARIVETPAGAESKRPVQEVALLPSGDVEHSGATAIDMSGASNRQPATGPTSAKTVDTKAAVHHAKAPSRRARRHRVVAAPSPAQPTDSDVDIITAIVRNAPTKTNPGH